MCLGCWNDYGAPLLVTPQITAAAKLIEELYDFSATGGNLHIVTDDWNLEDNHVEWCADRVARIQRGDIQEYDSIHPPQLAVEAEIIKLILPMSEEERASVLALECGYTDANRYEDDEP